MNERTALYRLVEQSCHRACCEIELSRLSVDIAIAYAVVGDRANRSHVVKISAGIFEVRRLEILDLFCLCVVDESASLCVGASNVASVSRDGDTPHQRIVLVRNVR